MNDLARSDAPPDGGNAHRSPEPLDRWAAIVVAYNSGPLLAQCVQSLMFGSADSPDVVVVDNGSRDGSIEALRAACPSARVVASPGNVGYARAANLGIAATRAPVVAVVNPDVIVAKGASRALLGRLQREPNLAAVGPRVHNPDGSQYPSARSEPHLLDAIGHGVLGLVAPSNRFTRRYRQLDADPAIPRDVDWLSGAAIWLRRDALDAVGGWDERYFLYMEDVDLCARLRAAGWRVAYEPAASVEHAQGASTAAHPYAMIVAHHHSAWIYAKTRMTGVRRVLLAPIAVFLTVRATITVADHALSRILHTARKRPRIPD